MYNNEAPPTHPGGGGEGGVETGGGSGGLGGVVRGGGGGRGGGGQRGVPPSGEVGWGVCGGRVGWEWAHGGGVRKGGDGEGWHLHCQFIIFAIEETPCI